MKNLTTYLFVIFMAMFWIFRMIVAFCGSMAIEFVVSPLDLNVEVILLFLTLVSMILVIKRNLLGGVIYLIGNGVYFGTAIFKAFSGVSIHYADILFSAIGIILPILVLMDLLLDKNRKEHPVDKKTDWFYQNKDYDRKLDERADKNQYKF